MIKVPCLYTSYLFSHASVSLPLYLYSVISGAFVISCSTIFFHIIPNTTCLTQATMPCSSRLPVKVRVTVPVATSSHSRFNKHRIARQRRADSITDARRTCTGRWSNIDSNLLDWRFITSQLITAMLCCAFCVVVEVGGQNKFELVQKSLVAAVPPALFFNAPLAPYMYSKDGEH
jgi:hypothetical protein